MKGLSASILFALCLSSALSLPVSNDREIDCTPTDGWSVIATTDNSESSEPALSQLIITLGTDFAEEPSEADADAFFANFEDTLGRTLCFLRLNSNDHGDSLLFAGTAVFHANAAHAR